MDRTLAAIRMVKDLSVCCRAKNKLCGVTQACVSIVGIAIQDSACVLSKPQQVLYDAISVAFVHLADPFPFRPSAVSERQSI
jgi:hypothetical protein